MSMQDSTHTAYSLGSVLLHFATLSQPVFQSVIKSRPRFWEQCTEDRTDYGMYWTSSSKYLSLYSSEFIDLVTRKCLSAQVNDRSSLKDINDIAHQQTEETSPLNIIDVIFPLKTDSQ